MARRDGEVCARLQKATFDIAQASEKNRSVRELFKEVVAGGGWQTETHEGRLEVERGFRGPDASEWHPPPYSKRCRSE